jgi:hypothetical protein
MPTVIPNDQSGNGSTSRYGSAHGRCIPETKLAAGDVGDSSDFQLDNTVRIERR